MSPDIARSLQARLRNAMPGSGDDFERTLAQFAAERWLYRLGVTSARERCVLKGATLLAVWLPHPHRATRDIDLLGLGSSDDNTIRELITEICEASCPEDGFVFDVSDLRVEPIREDTHNIGARARF